MSHTILAQPPAIDPAVWRTDIPLVVRERCENGEQMLVWQALRWLLAAYPKRQAFTTREIAKVAKVNYRRVGEWVCQLNEFGLIIIIGEEQVGNFPAKSYVYSLDLRRLEELSAAMAPRVLLDFGITEPPPPPPPEQQRLFDDDDLPYVREREHEAPHVREREHDHGRKYEQGHEHVRVREHEAPHVRVHEHAPKHDEYTSPESQIEPDTDLLDTRNHDHEAFHVRAHEHAHVRAHEHLEREREGEREGETHTPAESLSLPELVRAELRNALSDILPAMVKNSAAPARREAPAVPPDQPPIDDHPLDLWHDLYAEPRPFELRQLAALAAEHDQHTGGHGEYWLSKCILSAGLAHEQPTIRLIKSILDRWRAGSCYGSDAPAYEKRNGNGTSASPPADLPPEPAPPDPAPDDTDSHPAVQLYREKTGTQTSAAQARAIAGTVSNLDTWQQTLEHWKLNGWRTANVGNLLDAYRKRASDQPQADAPANERVSGLEIDLSPIHPTDKGMWMHRFREARTNTEKTQVLERFRAWKNEQGAANGTNGTNQS